MELECVFFSVTPYPASRSIIGLALTCSSRASSLIRTWFTSDMLIKTLPLPVAPHVSCLPRTQPLLHFRFSLRIPARLQALARSHVLRRLHPRALPPRLLSKPRRSLLPPAQRLRQRLPQYQPLPQARRHSRLLRQSSLLPHRLRIN